MTEIILNKAQSLKKTIEEKIKNLDTTNQTIEKLNERNLNSEKISFCNSNLNGMYIDSINLKYFLQIQSLIMQDEITKLQKEFEGL